VISSNLLGIVTMDGTSVSEVQGMSHDDSTKSQSNK
jgi:hypothetical protein